MRIDRGTRRVAFSVTRRGQRKHEQHPARAPAAEHELGLGGNDVQLVVVVILVFFVERSGDRREHGHRTEGLGTCAVHEAPARRRLREQRRLLQQSVLADGHLHERLPEAGQLLHGHRPVLLRQDLHRADLLVATSLD